MAAILRDRLVLEHSDDTELEGRDRSRETSEGPHRTIVVSVRGSSAVLAMLHRLNPVKWIDTLCPRCCGSNAEQRSRHRRGIQLAKVEATAADRAMAPHTKVFARASA